MKVRLTHNIGLIPAGTLGEAISFSIEDHGPEEEREVTFQCFFYGYTEVHYLRDQDVESL